MKTLLATFQKELLGVAELAESTVRTYLSSVVAFSGFADKTCNIDPLDTAGHHLLDCLVSIKHGISASRLCQHQFAIKKFFASHLTMTRRSTSWSFRAYWDMLRLKALQVTSNLLRKRSEKQLISFRR